MIKTLKKIDRFLLPKTEEMRFAPYVWLVYLSIFFTSLFHYNRLEYGYWYSAVGLLFFFYFYFHGYWSSPSKVKWDILGIAIIGSVLGIVTPGASVFFVYAGAFCCRLGNPKRAAIVLFILCIWIAVLSVTFSLSSFFYIPAVIFMLMIGGVNIFQVEMDKKKHELILSKQEIKALAKTAERERIARDLHDLIGHTFSVITLKAELANKLLDKDMSKARLEITELENISRNALKQVREVVTGYRTSDLNTELAHAKYVLESNDINFKYQFDDITIGESVNKELAIILKELVTNILKHARANRVDASIRQEKNNVVLTMSDDGKGFVGQPGEGYGLKGIQERVDKMAGSFTLESNKGAEFVIRVPLEEAL